MNNTKPALTPKQEAFCAFVVEGKDQTEAYRNAYKCPKAKPETIWSNASRLMADERIQQRIEELRAPVRERAQLTLETHLETLATLRDAAKAKEQYSAAISAEISRGKAVGLYVERVRDETPRSPEDLQRKAVKFLELAVSRKREAERGAA